MGGTTDRRHRRRSPISIARFIACLLLVLAGCLLPAPASPVAASSDQLPYRIQPGFNSLPVVDTRHLQVSASQQIAVWQDSRDGRPDIYAYDLVGRREFHVAPNAGYRQQPAISGSLVVWVSGSDPSAATIDGIDLRTNETFQVTASPAPVNSPAIDGQTVVWRQRVDGRWIIKGMNLSSHMSFQIDAGGVNEAAPSISGDVVAFQMYQDGEWDVESYDIPSGRITAITSTRDDEVSPIVDGQRLIYLLEPVSGGAPSLVLRDMSSGDQSTIVSGHLIGAIAMGGGLVAWEDWKTGLPDVYAYDIATQTTFAISRSQQAYSPAIGKGMVAWISRSDSGQSQVRAVTLTPPLPSDPQSAPAVPSPDRLYVPQTSHFISAGFKSYWQSHDGPSLFGYPLTEEFKEKDPQSGRMLTVQYFERVEMVYDPDAPAGSRVSLARLGSRLEQGRSFPKAKPGANSADRTYFPQTGYAIAAGFKQFWEQNGGLAVFGYPISNEITEHSRTVQYFERARFEYNPDAKDGASKISLGLLGREALEQLGWLPPQPVDTAAIVP